MTQRLYVRTPSQGVGKFRIIQTQQGFILFKLIFLMALAAGGFWIYGKVKSPSWKMPGRSMRMPAIQNTSGAGVEFTEKATKDQGKKYYLDYRGAR